MQHVFLLDCDTSTLQSLHVCLSCHKMEFLVSCHVCYFFWVLASKGVACILLGVAGSRMDGDTRQSQYSTCSSLSALSTISWAAGKAHAARILFWVTRPNWSNSRMKDSLAQVSIFVISADPVDIFYLS